MAAAPTRPMRHTSVQCVVFKPLVQPSSSAHVASAALRVVHIDCQYIWRFKVSDKPVSVSGHNQLRALGCLEWSRSANSEKSSVCKLTSGSSINVTAVNWDFGSSVASHRNRNVPSRARHVKWVLARSVLPRHRQRAGSHGRKVKSSKSGNPACKVAPDRPQQSDRDWSLHKKCTNDDTKSSPSCPGNSASRICCGRRIGVDSRREHDNASRMPGACESPLALETSSEPEKEQIQSGCIPNSVALAISSQSIVHRQNERQCA